ncbi:MAG: sugar transferase [Candidatus Peregrinibacteria bacterium]|nr:sugar transferase [Candidatus Peregrinibacteria bacterium]
MKKSEALFGIARVPLDSLAVFAALLLSYRLREASIDLLPWMQLLEPPTTLPSVQEYLQSFVALGILFFLVVAALLKLYTIRATLGGWAEFGRVLVAAGLWLVLVMGWHFLVLRELFYSRALLLHSVFFIVVFVSLGRASLILLQRSLLRTGIGRLLVVSVGGQALAHAALDTLGTDQRYRYLGHLPDMEAVKRLTHQQTIDLVVHTDPNPQSEATLALINYCRSHQIGYAFLPPVLADVPHQLTVERLGLLPMIRFQPTPLDGWGRIFKRLFDIVVSAVVLIILSPILIGIAIAILFETGRPIFYISPRIGGQGRRRFPMLKFRSMIHGADGDKTKLTELNHRRDGPLFKVRNDPRVTKVGKFLRHWTLDELPNLFNVLIGQMSLVGPRPHLPEEVASYSLEQRRVFAVKPGMTGLAQVSGRSNLPFDEEVRHDLQYIEEWSPLLDLWILWRTVFVIFGGAGAD